MLRIHCTHAGCPQRFKRQRGLTYHLRTVHRNSNWVNSDVPSVGEDFHDLDGLGHISPGAESAQPSWSQPPSPEPQQAPPPRPSQIFHLHLTGVPCDSEGNPLPPGTPPLPRTAAQPTDWSPFESEIQFQTVDFLYRRVEMSAGNIDELLEIWALDKMKSDQLGPFTSYEHMYSSINAIQLGDAPWKCFTVSYTRDVQPSDPSWKSAEYGVWFQDPEVIMTQMLDNLEFNGHFDYAPYVGLDRSGKWRWSDFMSGNYAWRHSDKIYEEDPTTEGALYCPIIAGSDKTTVSVATGHVEYHPFYISGDNLFNTVRCTHRNTIAPAGFLAIPKSDRKYDNDPAFRKFKRQLYHDSITAILKTFRPGMIKPVVHHCPDGHFRHVIYDLAAYIADYPEQVYLAGIVQNWCPKCTALPTNLDGLADSRSRQFTEGLVNELDSKRLWDEYGIDDDITPFTFHFPCADIHEMLSADLLHQLIKGTFKDHLVQWVSDYLYLEHGEARANEILDDIDRHIAAAPLFSGLHHFPHGRQFKQWMGDDSKALMKVYLPAILGYVPPKMVQCISTFLDACYIARRADITQESLAALQTAIERFHTHREIFCTSGEFGAPGGLCSSITESRHITAVKRPWRRSNHYEALGKMLLTNQQLDKLLRACADFIERRMLPPSHLPPPKPIIPLGDDDEDTGVIDKYVTGNVALARTQIRAYPRHLAELANHIGCPPLIELTRRFLYDQLHTDDGTSSADIPIQQCPYPTSKVSVFHSAVATFYAPSDKSGIWGMRTECIRSTPSWQKHRPHDCALVVEDQDKPGMRGMSVVQVKLLFSFEYDGKTYPCALVDWFKRVGMAPNSETGMWKVRPETYRNGQRIVSILHLDTFLCSAHLLPVFGQDVLLFDFHFSYSLDVFESYFVNKYADHHAHEICF
ncbi:uncharacterized protein LACBIDRAFT_306911 [Laccaria bicolor S238N-H82]|uniref:Predicted protein n=1 Tax=Laccaria bicolor (strain S238N-H82 / ATCC MYA-4686) TaxID=486041 RepID=B0DNZ4_LACBS|nr:uncharacterized protein LACBIDRAFT_306911 [Laccaria bicolor S238N-H82]EDR03732.1 predicted protein [Laccaria bicolor S238N-H82]|eukprot:XP_001885585.1 predicted protein [Laccaria bicolor S238N-H82]